MDAQPAGKRNYRQVKRADAAAQTHQRIAGASLELFLERPYDEVRVIDIAARARVSEPTVHRLFAGKEALVRAGAERLGEDALPQRDSARVGDVEDAVETIVDHYEEWGESTFRFHGQEERVPVFAELLDRGRDEHRQWVLRVFHPQLAPLAPAERDRAADAALAATDLYLWKLLRQDHGRSREPTIDVMTRLLRGVLTPS